jgi:MFS transporter, FHS family, L-fucose permease
MMLKPFKPRYMLATYLFLCFVFSVAAMNTTGNTSIGLLIMVFCFESCCFATIFTLALRSLGRHTKRGGSFLVAAISGGTVFPPMMGAVVTRRNAHVAMAIPMMGYVLAWVFPLSVNFFNRETMDQRRETDLGIVAGPTDKEIGLERAGRESVSGKEATEVVEHEHHGQHPPKQIGSMGF